jgi:hypothetical protein
MNRQVKEAKAKFRIDLSASILKATFLGIMVLPLTLIMKSAVEGNAGEVLSFTQALSQLSHGAYLTLLLLLITSGFTAAGCILQA